MNNLTLNPPIPMTQEQLKELVKEYFNLTEIKLGEIYDENKAFKIVFEGDTLELGMKVKVVTTEGQEMDAPDGYHRLEDGKEIKTEGSVVTEITTATEEEKEEMAELPAEQFPVEVTKEDKSDVAEESTAIPEMMETEEAAMDKEEIVKAIAEAVAGQLEEMKKEMAYMKDKIQKMSAEPAAEKTLPKAKMSADVNDSVVDQTRYEMMKKLIANKIK
jgi:hypothetical protein